MSDQHYFHNFQTAAAEAPSQGWAAYWLGRSFSAGGLTFQGPYLADFGDDFTGGAGVTYGAPNDGPILDVYFYGPAAWEKVRNRQEITPVGSTTRMVQVAGHEARLVSSPAGTRPVNDLVLYVQMGDTMVVADAKAGGSATPGGPDVNPLVDEQTFLAVLQHLRPYPQ